MGSYRGYLNWLRILILLMALMFAGKNLLVFMSRKSIILSIAAGAVVVLCAALLFPARSGNWAFGLADRFINTLYKGMGYDQVPSPENSEALKKIYHSGRMGTLYDGSMRGANFDGADLTNAPLSGAYLVDASFRDAILHKAMLRGAILHGANLRGANLAGAKFSRRTMLPDGSMWRRRTDLAMFTNPEHPEFFDLEDEPEDATE